ncbi:flagellar hook-basal body complex protein FliE [Arthrobacter sp. GCM10027362]|uniref:flagellar hook-basal body complex protein FliE n=1 Tax=Arthrobacter sp. GCM10027362 TaxID=3273379 RepID=UPI003644AA72
MPLPVSAIASAVAPVQGVAGTGYLAGAKATNDAPAPGGTGFASALAGAVDNVQQLQSTSKELAIKAVTGDLNDIHTATLASTRAQVTLELVAAVRNKGVDAFNEIMRMQA